MAIPYQPPFVPPNAEPWVWRLFDVVRGVLGGKLNATGSVTLTDSVASTDIIDPRISIESVILFMPTTANAATEAAAGGMYVSAQLNGSATVTHSNGPSTDRTFRYLVIG